MTTYQQPEGEGRTFHFDSSRSDYCTCFMIDGDKVGYLADAIYPPVGSIVDLTGGRQATVQSVRLDISGTDGLAMIYVALVDLRYPYGPDPRG
ncbi:hypothetical protein DEI93_03215 [Curtobacterium sp. MCBD17_035]|uniref:hypothetical protein n=1 Tax=Curtobacterium sp. MCBD17_035 TaxID=2175673 RepID=UPI000DA87170|nr:hypothetical protein [Curtobacterium sp. MCBD17_035]WIB68067.1 hypothetical protein DEI93_03215 [Curtobacterium sp. MCBD17_035]